MGSIRVGILLVAAHQHGPRPTWSVWCPCGVDTVLQYGAHAPLDYSLTLQLFLWVEFDSRVQDKSSLIRNIVISEPVALMNLSVSSLCLTARISCMKSPIHEGFVKKKIGMGNFRLKVLYRRPFLLAVGGWRLGAIPSIQYRILSWCSFQRSGPFFFLSF